MVQIRRTMRRLGVGVAGVIASGAATYGLGLLLPVQHTASLSQQLDGPPEEVWSLITDVERFPDWRPDVIEATRLEERGGRPVFRERGTGGTLTFAIEALEPGHRMVTRIIDEGLPFGGSWTYDLVPVNGGVRLTITEDGEVYDPLFRVVSRFVLGHDRTLQRYMAAVQARIEEG